MTHELKNIVHAFIAAKENQLKTVLATVVDLDGSSYRKPGVRMLILENEQTIGAVSGGCVEKDIVRQAMEVFKTGQSKMMTYDGRYRLGCEGVLYILLEIFDPSPQFIEQFKACLTNRTTFKIVSSYQKEEGIHTDIGSLFQLNIDNIYSISGSSIDKKIDSPNLTFSQLMPPCFRLVIIGAEHDAVQLCLMASILGWEVTVVSSVKEPKSKIHFPGAHEVTALSPHELTTLHFDNQTAVVLMTHNFAQDLKSIIALKDETFVYLGVLGPVKRKEKLLSELIIHHPEVNYDIVSNIHGPAGLNIGAETPQEIATSIVAEILSITKNKYSKSLSEKKGTIHDHSKNTYSLEH